MSEKRITFLGSLDVSQDEAIALDVDLNADPETIKLAIGKANAERLAETKALRELTGLDADKESGK